MSLQTLLNDLRSPGVTSTRIGAAVLALVVVTLAVIAYLGLPLVGLAGQNAPGELKVVSPEHLAQRKARFAQRNTLGQERITARWPFYNVPPKVVSKPTEPVPARYGGPALIAMVNGAAWFQDGKRLRPGDAEVDGLQVIEVNAPWSARVKWRGGEFTVTLFDRDPVRLTGGLDELRRNTSGMGVAGGSAPAPTANAAPLAASTSAGARPSQPGVPGAQPAAGATLGALPGNGPSSVSSVRLPSSIEMPGGGRISIPMGGTPGQPQVITMPDGRTATMIVSPVVSSTPGVSGQQVMIAVPGPGAPPGTAVPAPDQPAQVVEMDVVVEADPAQPAEPQTEDPEKKND